MPSTAVTLVAFAAAFAAPADCAGQQPSGATGYRQIIEEYEQAARILVRQNAPRAQLREVAQTRDARLAELVAEAELAPSNVPPEDWAAFAAACEYLQRREDCLRYGRRAIDADPSVELAYAPVIRTLLNLKQPKEAVSLLNEARTHLSPTSDLFSLHYFVYRRYQFDGDPVSALKSFTAFMDFQAARFNQSDEATAQAAAVFLNRLDEFQNSFKPAMREHEAKPALLRYLQRVESILDRIRSQAEHSPGPGQVRSQAIARLLQLREELERRSKRIVSAEPAGDSSSQPADAGQETDSRRDDGPESRDGAPRDDESADSRNDSDS